LQNDWRRWRSDRNGRRWRSRWGLNAGSGLKNFFDCGPGKLFQSPPELEDVGHYFAARWFFVQTLTDFFDGFDFHFCFV
jgi:phosphatidylglycerophosphate synthase